MKDKSFTRQFVRCINCRYRKGHDYYMSDFAKIYELSINATRNLFEDIRFSRNLNFDYLRSVSDQICSCLNTEGNILNLLHSTEDQNPYVYSHPAKVAFVSYVIGKWMNMKEGELSKLVFTGLVHDIGKAKIRDSVLNKPDKLTEQETLAVRNHPTVGYRLLTTLGLMEPDILSGILSHHERMDGSGYPRKLKGDQINRFGKIIAIADIYDAMTSKRPYSDKNTPFKAMDEIEALSFGLLDPEISQVFLHKIMNFYYGSTVRLNNDRIGEIIYVNQEERTKPLIHCENEYIDLTQDRNIEIVEIL